MRRVGYIISRGERSNTMLERWHRLSKKAQWGVAVLVIFGGLVVVGALAGTDTPSTPRSYPSPAPSASISDDAVDEALDAIDEAIEDAGLDYGSGLSSGQENAVGQAESYLRSSSFSRK